MDRLIVGYIYRPYMKTPKGDVIYARSYGKRAFRIPVYADDNEPKRA